jgi:DNA-binding NtrC family response regulator
MEELAAPLAPDERRLGELAAAPSAPLPAGERRRGHANLREEVDALERQRVLDALVSCGGNQSRAAKLLGISRNTLIARLDHYGVPRPRARAGNRRE